MQQPGAEVIMRLQLSLPRVRGTEDPLHHFTAFHEAVRDVMAWAPSIIDEEGNARPGDARLVRDFLGGPLLAHLEDEATELIPRLSHRRGAWLDGVLALALRGHERVREAAEPVRAIATALARGEAMSPKSWRDSLRDLGEAVDRALVFEEGVLLPTARLLLDDDERTAMRDGLKRAEEARPTPLLDWSELDPLIPRRVSTVRTRQQSGLDVIQAMADCPRRRTVDVEDACARCAYLEDARIAPGGGALLCSIEPTPGPARVADIMTRDVQCVSPEVGARELVQLLATRGVTGLPVVDAEGRPVGIVSQSDVVRALATGEAFETLSVRALMMHVPFVVDENAAIEDAARLVAFESVHRLPVINAERVVVGVVSALDLVRWSICRA
jgi:CBS domain-containing protein